MTLRLEIEMPGIFENDVTQERFDEEVEELNKLLTLRGYNEVSIHAMVVEDEEDGEDE